MSGWFDLHGWFEWLQNKTGFNSEIEIHTMEPEDVSLYIAKSRMLGEGESKKAFSIEEKKNSEYCFTLPNGTDVGNFCLVEYKNPIKWVRDEDKTHDNESEETNELIAELKKMYELSMEKNGRAYAPKLREIKIDDVTEDDPNDHVQGVPFPPENMNDEFEKIKSDTKVKISYLIKRCDDNVIEFISKYPTKMNEVSAKIIEFINSYVETHEELNSDIKSENLCTTIVDGSVVLVGMLDADPKFSVYGNSEEFKHNAKIFMKYEIIGHSVRIGDNVNGNKETINFGNLGITQNDVDNMIRFFYKPEYMKEYFNPIAMLYHYYAGEHPGFFLDIPLPTGWIATQSQTTGKIYYANTITKQSQWDKPKHPYEFLSNDGLKKYFSVENMVILFQKLNARHGVVLLPAISTMRAINKKGATAKKSSNKPVNKPANKDVITESRRSSRAKSDTVSSTAKKTAISRASSRPPSGRTFRGGKRGRKARTRKN